MHLSKCQLSFYISVKSEKGNLTTDFEAESYAVDSFSNNEIILKLSEIGTNGCKPGFIEQKRPNTKF